MTLSASLAAADTDGPRIIQLDRLGLDYSRPGAVSKAPDQEELLRYCNEALDACDKAIESKDAVIVEQDKVINMQADEIIKLREDSSTGILESPIFWGCVGLITGVLISR